MPEEQLACRFCGEAKPLSEMMKGRVRKDGTRAYRNICTACNNARVKEWRASFKASDPEGFAAWQHRHNTSEAAREARKRWYEKTKNDPLWIKKRRQQRLASYHRRYKRRRRTLSPTARVKAYSRTILNAAVRDGTVIRQSCEVCGSQVVEAHHEDYLKPLEVRWLCREHHLEKHLDETAA